MSLTPLNRKELRKALMRLMRSREASMKKLLNHVKEKFWKQIKESRISDEALEKKIRKIMGEEPGVERAIVKIEQKGRGGTSYTRSVLGYKLKDTGTKERKVEHIAPRIKLNGLRNQIFVAISENPEIKYETNIADLHHTYFLSAGGEICGVNIDEDEIMIQVKLDDLNIPDELWDETLGDICDEVYKRICKAVPEIKKTKVCIVLEYPGNTYECEYP